MRTTEKLKLAFPALLAQCEKSPVQISYRGLNDNNEKVYEVKRRDNTNICMLGTERQVLDALVTTTSEVLFEKAEEK